MSELHFETVLSDDISVTVYFDYQPKEPMTRYYPGCEALATINAVLIDNDENKDLYEIIGPRVFNILQERALESMAE